MQPFVSACLDQSETVLRLPAFSAVHFVGPECELRDLTLEVRGPSIWWWVLPGCTLRLRRTSLRRVGDCGP